MDFEAMEYKTRQKVRNTLTFDRLKDMCVERHIDFGDKNKAELIDLLSEFMELKTGDTVAISQPEVTSQPEVNVQIMKMLIQRQEMQMPWLEREKEDRIAKEKELRRQEKREMEKMGRKKEQRFLLELMKELADSKKEKDTVKLPKPVFQKFTEREDIESF